MLAPSNTVELMPDLKRATSRLHELVRAQPELSEAATLCERMLSVLFCPKSGCPPPTPRSGEPSHARQSVGPPGVIVSEDESAQSLPGSGEPSHARQRVGPPEVIVSEDEVASRLAQSLPLLRGTTWSIDPAVLKQRWLQVCELLGHDAGRKLAAAAGPVDLAAALRGVVEHGPESFRHELDQYTLPSALGCTVLRFAALPLLHPLAVAHEPSWERTGWSRGYCPMCGSWPLLSEYRGLEQFRFLRCALCGSSWPTDRLFCPFCETRDHRKLSELLLESAAPRLRVATCDGCRGYLCGLATLERLSPAELLVAEVETLPLACVAQRQGYREPGVLDRRSDTGHSLR